MLTKTIYKELKLLPRINIYTYEQQVSSSQTAFILNTKYSTD